MDLGQDKMVSGVVIQGGKHRDRNVFMKRFKVGHSLDGENWTIIKEDNTTRQKVVIFIFYLRELILFHFFTLRAAGSFGAPLLEV